MGTAIHPTNSEAKVRFEEQRFTRDFFRTYAWPRQSNVPLSLARPNEFGHSFASYYLPPFLHAFAGPQPSVPRRVHFPKKTYSSEDEEFTVTSSDMPSSYTVQRSYSNDTHSEYSVRHFNTTPGFRVRRIRD